MKCDFCGKTRQTGNTVSHSNVKTKRTWKPNIQKLRVEMNGTKTRVNICMRCLKSRPVTRPVHASPAE